jgi:2-C-methyl-D-erythritol 4-phosphate cytidylyltransferase
LIDACYVHDQGGLLAVPVPDTLKRAAAPLRTGGAAGGGEAGAAPPPIVVARTLDREGLWLAQTPQMFRAGELLAALEATAEDARVTDEASAMELAGPAGCAPLLVPGARSNAKLTWPEDFEWLDLWFSRSAR